MATGRTVLVESPLAALDAVFHVIDLVERGEALPWMSKAIVDPVTDASGSVEVNGEAWSRDEVMELSRRTEYETVHRLFERLRDAGPGTWIPKPEEAEGESPYLFRNQLAAWTKLIWRLFELEHWPIDYRRDGGPYYYRVDPRVLGWWFEALA